MSSTVYKVYRQKSKFYIVDSLTGFIRKDDLSQVKINRTDTNSTLFTFQSDDIGLIEIDVTNIRTKTGKQFESANAFEFWADRNTGMNADDETNLINHAANIILENFGHVISVEDKGKDLTKFGENKNVQASGSAIMDLQGSETEETMINTNGITYVVSSSSSDTQLIKILEGHTIDGNNDLTFNAYSGDGIQLQGRTPVALPTALARANRARLSSKAVGNIYFYEGGAVTNGVPNDASTTHLMIRAGEIQTQKAATSISKDDYYLITSGTISIGEKTASWADGRLEIKAVTESEFYPVTQNFITTDGAGTFAKPVEPFGIVRPNHDLRVWARANTNGVFLASGIEGLLAKIIR